LASETKGFKFIQAFCQTVIIPFFQVVKFYLVLLIADTEAETKEKLSAPVSKSPVTIQEAELSNGVSAGVSALTSLCSAYASDSEDNEGQTGTYLFG